MPASSGLVSGPPTEKRTSHGEKKCSPAFFKKSKPLGRVFPPRCLAVENADGNTCNDTHIKMARNNPTCGPPFPLMTAIRSSTFNPGPPWLFTHLACPYKCRNEPSWLGLGFFLHWPNLPNSVGSVSNFDGDELDPLDIDLPHSTGSIESWHIIFGWAAWWSRWLIDYTGPSMRGVAGQRLMRASHRDVGQMSRGHRRCWSHAARQKKCR